MAKFFLPGWTVRKGEGVNHGIHLHPDFFSDLENYNKGGNQMGNEIETSVDIRAKLEQVAEECGELTKACMKLIRASGELTKACMKLIRAIGNGNPCNVSEEEAIEAVIEEMSDLEVAAGYLQMTLDERTDFDVRARMNAIADIKIKRWQGRIAEAQDKADSCADKDYCDIFSSF